MSYGCEQENHRKEGLIKRFENASKQKHQWNDQNVLRECSLPDGHAETSDQTSGGNRRFEDDARWPDIKSFKIGCRQHSRTNAFQETDVKTTSEAEAEVKAQCIA